MQLTCVHKLGCFGVWWRRALLSTKEAVTLHQRDAEQLQQLRQQQNRFARHIRAEKSGETAAKEATAAARHAEELRKVTNQRNALAAALKKQFKLIEVLKQQKAHLEAARLLQFTEEEFLKVVGSDGMMKQHLQQELQRRQRKEQLEHPHKLAEPQEGVVQFQKPEAANEP